MPARPPHKQNAEMLFKGVVCALIGAVILAAPETDNPARER